MVMHLTLGMTLSRGLLGYQVLLIVQPLGGNSACNGCFSSGLHPVASPSSCPRCVVPARWTLSLVYHTCSTWESWVPHHVSLTSLLRNVRLLLPPEAGGCDGVRNIATGPCSATLSSPEPLAVVLVLGCPQSFMRVIAVCRRHLL